MGLHHPVGTKKAGAKILSNAVCAGPLFRVFSWRAETCVKKNANFLRPNNYFVYIYIYIHVCVCICGQILRRTLPFPEYIIL